MARYLVLSIIVIVIAVIPLRVIGYGFIPPDDAQRHAAKVISGKNWDEILVLRDDIKMDSHPGWHAILKIFQRFTDCDQAALIVFSVVILFIFFAIIPIFFLKYPEAWLFSLVTVVISSPSMIMRLFLGRPYIFTMAYVVALCLLWPTLRDRKNNVSAWAIIILFTLASTWIHCSWHLLFLPVICFFLAQKWRLGFRLCISTIIGIILGALLTGQPHLFLKQMLLHSVRAFGNHAVGRILVSEFQPFSGDPFIVFAVTALLLWRRARGKWDKKIIYNPVFILAGSGFILGYVSVRFWLDWGVPAILAWMALEYEEIIKDKIDYHSNSRIIFTLLASIALYFGITNDHASRWTGNLDIQYLSLSKKEHKDWLPEPGGVVYTSDMGIFYQIFYENPNAPWRYILGFEPTMMPEEDLAIYRKIQRNYGAYETFKPWVNKMKPEDRLIIKHPSLFVPQIERLEWRLVVRDTWVGRLPRRDIVTKKSKPKQASKSQLQSNYSPKAKSKD